MEVSSLYLCFMISLLYLSGADCNNDSRFYREGQAEGESATVILSRRLDAIEKQRIIDQEGIINEQEKQIASLRAELKTNIKQRVREALTDILRSETVEDVIRSDVLPEVKQQKRAQRQLRRQMHRINTDLEKVQEDNMAYKQSLRQAQRQRCDLARHLSYLQSKLNLEQYRFAYLQVTLGEACRPVFVESRGGEAEPATPSPVQPHTTQTSTPPTTLTTFQPPKDRTRILVAPMWIATYHQFRQVAISDKVLSIYPHLSLKNVNSAVYVSKINSLLINLRTSKKIISSHLDTPKTKVIHRNIKSYGMAVDEKTWTVFLTTYHPNMTISRMGIHGEDFTSIIYTKPYGKGGYPRAIAVHPETQTIYSCDFDHLFSIKYDGSDFRKHSRGININAVSLDVNNGLLYYGKHKHLLKMSLDTGVSSEVTQLDFALWNLAYYNDTVYFMSFDFQPSTLGALDVGQDTVTYTQVVNITDVYFYGICLIP